MDITSWSEVMRSADHGSIGLKREITEADVTTYCTVTLTPLPLSPHLASEVYQELWRAFCDEAIREAQHALCERNGMGMESVLASPYRTKCIEHLMSDK